MNGPATTAAPLLGPRPPVPTEPASPSTVAGASASTFWRRYRLLVGALLGLLVAATAIGVARTRSPGGDLDPHSTDPGGSRALAALVADRGVAVRRVTDPAQLTSAVSARTVLLVAFPEALGVHRLRSLGALQVGTVLLVAPDRDQLAAVTGAIRVDAQIPVEKRGSGCTLAAAEAAGRAVVGGRTYVARDGSTCYPGGASGALVTGRTTGGGGLVVLGTGAPLTNDLLDDEGNAALALNLLGADGSADEVRWLVPSPGTAGDGDGDGLLPPWVSAAIMQLLIAGLLAALWRGRRLGPPVTEPLPVVVRAAETVEGRARLYRRAQARDRAAGALRSGALARLVPRLGIEPGARGEPAPETVVAAVTGRSGHPAAEVQAALFGPPPGDDAGLVRLSETLDSLVRDTLEPEVPNS